LSQLDHRSYDQRPLILGQSRLSPKCVPLTEIDGAEALTSVEDALKMPEIVDLSMELDTNKA
jgi:hypothetical protein